MSPGGVWGGALGRWSRIGRGLVGGVVSVRSAPGVCSSGLRAGPVRAMTPRRQPLRRSYAACGAPSPARELGSRTPAAPLARGEGRAGLERGGETGWRAAGPRLTASLCRPWALG